MFACVILNAMNTEKRCNDQENAQFEYGSPARTYHIQCFFFVFRFLLLLFLKTFIHSTAKKKRICHGAKNDIFSNTAQHHMHSDRVSLNFNNVQHTIRVCRRRHRNEIVVMYKIQNVI